MTAEQIIRFSSKLRGQFGNDPRITRIAGDLMKIYDQMLEVDRMAYRSELHEENRLQRDTIRELTLETIILKRGYMLEAA